MLQILHIGLAIGISVSVLLFRPSLVQAEGRPMGELIDGQWAEGRAFDPFGDRPIQIWLPEGTLIYDIEESNKGGANRWKYRFAKTYHGYPVNVRLRKTKEKWNYKRLAPNTYSARFRLNQSVFCPAETSPIVWPRSRCLSGEATGEGWTFEFSPGATEAGEPPYFEVQGIPDEQTKKDLGDSKSLYSFKFYEKDMKLLEDKGVLFRLDRPHPIVDFDFVGHYYFPCNSETIAELKQEEIEKKFVEASLEAGFSFWNWFKLTLKGGIGYEDKESEIRITRTKVTSGASSVFQQWGIMHLRNKDDGSEDVPFFIEKKFECHKDSGTSDPGSKILSVEVQFWNDEEDRNDTYEFNKTAPFIVIDDELYNHIQRPIFLSINSSEGQARIIEKLLKENQELHFNQAIFIFAQLNNGCSGKDRDKCRSSVSVAKD